ncbi:hypothetical protein SAMN02910409_1395 [Prevotellaceae bacterium HUN156]|nr:hypothetical protein SAMN02910409_1395 [Prevotellaceae bacterium HUN156]
MKHFLTLLGLLIMVCSCSKDEAEQESVVPARRTVIVYMAGDNNLSSYMYTDLSEMAIGRQLVGKGEDLVVFVDRAATNEKPFIARITASGEQEKLYEYPIDFYSSDADHFAEVLSRCIQLCPATEDYGLVLWGHASGWLIESDSISNSVYGSRRAYGVDNNMWMNIPSMRQALQSLNIKWKFIFSDCCNMQNIETAYELKDVAEYLIASPAEIPGKGAPYNTVVPTLFIHNDKEMYEAICDKYYEQTDTKGGHLPISVIRTDKLNALAVATKAVLPEVVNNLPHNDYGMGHIYYFCLVGGNSWGNNYDNRYKALYDMNDIIRWATVNDQTAYNTWKAALDQAVIYKKMSTFWHANYLESDYTEKSFYDFTVTEEAYGGVSMFFPLEKYNNGITNFNKDIKKMGWYYAVGWSELGW